MSTQTTLSAAKRIILSLTLVLLVFTASFADGPDTAVDKGTVNAVITGSTIGANYTVVLNTTEVEPATVKVINARTKEVVYSEKIISNQKFTKTYKLDNLVSGNYTIEVQNGLKTSVKEIYVR